MDVHCPNNGQQDVRHLNVRKHNLSLPDNNSHRETPMLGEGCPLRNNKIRKSSMDAKEIRLT